MRPFSGFGSMSNLIKARLKSKEDRELEKRNQIEAESVAQEIVSREKQEARNAEEEQQKMIKLQRSEISNQIKRIKENAEIYTLDFLGNNQFDEVQAAYLVDALRSNLKLIQVKIDQDSSIKEYWKEIIDHHLRFNYELQENFKTYGDLIKKDSMQFMKENSVKLLQSLSQNIEIASINRDAKNLEMRIILFCLVGDIIEKKYIDYYEKQIANAKGFENEKRTDFKEFKNEKGIIWHHPVIKLQSEISQKYQKALNILQGDKDVCEITEETMNSAVHYRSDYHQDFFKEFNPLKDKDFILQCLRYRDNISLAEINNFRNVCSVINGKPNILIKSAMPTLEDPVESNLNQKEDPDEIFIMDLDDEVPSSTTSSLKNSTKNLGADYSNQKLK